MAENEDPNAEAPGVNEMIERDKGSWERRLREEAGKKGLAYDPSDLEGVIRQVSYAKNVGKDPANYINDAVAGYARRAAPNTPAAPRDGGTPPPGPAPTNNGDNTNPDGMASWTGKPSPQTGPDPYQQAALDAIKQQSTLMQQMMERDEASRK